MRFNQCQCELPIIQLAPDPSSVAGASGSVGPKPGSMGPIGPKGYPLGNPKIVTDGPVPTPLPSAKFGRPPPTLAKFSSSGPPTGLGGVKTLECEQLKSTCARSSPPPYRLAVTGTGGKEGVELGWNGGGCDQRGHADSLWAFVRGHIDLLQLQQDLSGRHRWPPRARGVLFFAATRPVSVCSDSVQARPPGLRTALPRLRPNALGWPPGILGFHKFFKKGTTRLRALCPRAACPRPRSLALGDQ
eukprot:scaffold9150_cov120-Isochrysis_galbana.AAC.3